MRPLLLAALALASAAVVPAAHAEVLPTGCTVALVAASAGASDTCSYTAVGTSGTHTIRVYAGWAVTQVTCTAGGNYMSQPAGHAVNMPFDRTGSCTLTITAMYQQGTTTATASAD